MEIKEIVKNAEPDEAYLLISATTKMKDCKDIIKAYSFLEEKGSCQCLLTFFMSPK